MKRVKLFNIGTDDKGVPDCAESQDDSDLAASLHKRLNEGGYGHTVEHVMHNWGFEVWLIIEDESYIK